MSIVNSKCDYWFKVWSGYRRSSFNVVNGFLERRQNDVYRNQFYHRLIDINRSFDSVSDIIMKTLNKMMLLEEDLL